MEISHLVKGIKIYIKEYSKLATESGIIRRDISEFLKMQLKNILVGYTEEEIEFIVTKSNIILTDSKYAHIIESIKQDSVAEGTIEQIINMSDSVLKGWSDSYEGLKSIPGGKKTKRRYKSKAKKSKKVKKSIRRTSKKSKTYKKIKI